MKQLLSAALIFSLTALPALAAPTAEQKADFYKTCMGIAQDDTLCSCKAEAAMTLIDERFMGVVISGMKGKAPAAADYSAYNSYVAKSNQVCKPNY